jgi:CRP/FNR family transcriptional regulator
MKAAMRIASLTTLPIRAPAVNCASCSLNKMCLSTGLDLAETVRLDRIVKHRRRVDRGERLFSAGDPFKNLYAVRFGHFKAFRITPSGDQQVVGFHTTGEVLGLDAIGAEHHHSTAVALEDSEICEIPFARFDELFMELPQMQRHFHRLMSNEIMREQSAMMFLGSMMAEQRLALFLLNQGKLYAARGYSPTTFQLRMSREDIGNYLGLTIESVSRLLLRFRQKGWLRVAQREVELLDLVSIEALASGLSSAEPIATRPRQVRPRARAPSAGGGSLMRAKPGATASAAARSV